MTQAPTKHANDDTHVQLLYVLTSALRDEAGMTEQEACCIARQALSGMSKTHGGLYLYCPMRAFVDRAQRDAEIRRRFNGRNLDELQRKFGLKRRRLYQIATGR
jgi:Mor family transcriptional regulator